MDKDIAKEIVDKIVGQIFGCKNPLTLDQFLSKFAFDINLPQLVYDSTSNEPTWAQSTNPTKFISMNNVIKRGKVDDWVLPKRPINGIEDILSAWNETNFMTTERVMKAINVAESDNINPGSQNIFRSQDCGESKNLVFCNGIYKSEFAAACQRSITLNFCMRTEDSRETSNSFGVIWSAKIADSFFIQDCFNLSNCMFCSHLVSKQYCIANMQFEKEEYMKLRKEVIKWILTS